MRRLFITGIPTSGKSYLAKKLADEVGGIAVFLDDYREELTNDERYKKWVNLYLDKDEKSYLEKTDSDKQWANLVAQSEALWPAFLEKINSFSIEANPVIFECVNLLPHLMQKQNFSGLVLIGDSYENVLKRNTEYPRWGETRQLQELEAMTFFNVERPRYTSEAKKYGYPIFETADQAHTKGLELLK